MNNNNNSILDTKSIMLGAVMVLLAIIGYASTMIADAIVESTLSHDRVEYVPYVPHEKISITVNVDRTHIDNAMSSNAGSMDTDKYTYEWLKDVVLEKYYNNYADVNLSELLSLTIAIYGESAGESELGRAAVADVIRNRVNSPLFPNTYYEVVTQYRQFSCITNPEDLLSNINVNNNMDYHGLIEGMALAYRTITGKLNRITYNALFYHTKEVNPYWARAYDKLGTIGNHIFYTSTRL